MDIGNWFNLPQYLLPSTVPPGINNSPDLPWPKQKNLDGSDDDWGDEDSFKYAIARQAYIILNRPPTPFTPAESESMKIESNVLLGLKKATEHLAYCLNFHTPHGPLGIIKARRMCLNWVCSCESLTWNLDTEQLVKLLKICFDAYDLAPFDDMAKSYKERMSRADKMENCKGAIECLQAICGKLSGSDSYNFFDALLGTSYCHSLPITVHLTGKLVTRNDSVIRNYHTHILLLIKKSVLAARKSLSFAENKHIVHKTIPYTTFSLTAGKSLQDLLNVLMSLVAGTKQDLKRSDIVDTLLTVIEVIPFKRFDQSCLKDVINMLVKYIEERPEQVERVFTSRIAITLLRADGIEKGVDTDLLKSPHSGKDLRVILAKKAVKYLSYWVTICVVGDFDKRIGHEGRMEDRHLHAGREMLILTVLAKNHFMVFKEEAQEAVNLVLYILSLVGDIKHKLNVIKDKRCMTILEWKSLYEAIMSVVTEALAFLEAMTAAVGGRISASSTDDLSETYIRQFVEKWLSFFNYAPLLMECGLNAIPARVLDCFAAVKAEFFDQMGAYNRQSAFLASILGYSRDRYPEIRAKAGRCLAIMLELWIVVQNDPHFVLDALDTIEYNIYDGDLTMRSTYAWALGNMTDSLYGCYEGQVPLSGGFKFIKRIFKLAAKCSADKPKVRYNAHRTIGCLLRWLPSDNFNNPEIAQIIEKSVQILTKQVGKGSDFKARWNASYAIGCILQNHRLIHVFGPNIIGPILICLSQGAASSENFKERIQCLKGLAMLKERALYGEHFYTVWEKIFKAVFISEANRQNLVPQIGNLIEDIRVKVGSCLAHWVGLIQGEDISRLERIIVQNSDSFRELIHHAVNLGLPEQEEYLLRARQNILRLKIKPASEFEVVIGIFDSSFYPTDFLKIDQMI